MNLNIKKQINDIEARFEIKAEANLPSDAYDIEYTYFVTVKDEDKNTTIFTTDFSSSSSTYAVIVPALQPGTPYYGYFTCLLTWAVDVIITVTNPDGSTSTRTERRDYSSTANEEFNFYTHPGIWYWIKIDGVTIGVKTDEFLADYLTVDNYNKFRIWVGQYNSWFDQISDYENYSNLPEISTATFITAELYNNMLKASDVDNKYINGGNEIITREKKDNLITAAAFNLFTEKGFPMTKWGF